MKIFTLFELQQFEGYHLMKRLLNEAEIQFFYNTPEAQRGALLGGKVITKVAPKQLPRYEAPKPSAPLKRNELRQTAPPKVMHTNPSTQMCTTVDIDSVRDMALDYIGRNWTYRGRTFNLTDMGWKFKFNDRKNANGMCSPNSRTLFLSTFIIEGSTREMDGWINTMVHEIAHAINHHLGGRGHDWQWKNIFLSFGGSGERCSSDVTFADLIKNPISKYTLVCPNGHHKPSHKYSKVVERGHSACPKCCKEFNDNKFSSKYALTQHQNY